jgi:phosphatidylglycerophosphate synthase
VTQLLEDYLVFAPEQPSVACRYRNAIVSLGASQKTSKGAPAYSRYINRPLGRRFAALAFISGRTPNQVTAVSAAFTMSAIALIAIARPTLATSALIAVLLVIGYALDAADGQLARLRGGGSASGEWLDHTVDAIKISVLHLAVLVSWYRFDDVGDQLLLVPLGFQAVATVQFFSIILMDQIRRARRGNVGSIMTGERSSSPLYSLLVLPTDYGLLCVALGLMFWQEGFVWMYTAFFAANAAFMALALPRWYREVGTLS